MWADKGKPWDTTPFYLQTLIQWLNDITLFLSRNSIVGRAAIILTVGNVCIRCARRREKDLSTCGYGRVENVSGNFPDL